MAYTYGKNGSPALRDIGKRNLTGEDGAAKILNMSRSFVQKDRLKAQPLIPYIRLPNGRVKYDTDELNRLVETWHEKTNARVAL